MPEPLCDPLAPYGKPPADAAGSGIQNDANMYACFGPRSQLCRELSPLKINAWRNPGSARSIGSDGDRICRSGSGERSARTTAPNGTAWESFPFEHAHARTYRWGEDGIGGISDRHQMICFALAMWNGRDPILKERLFGLTGNQGNHGEDVKEQYFYLDSTPTHSYMRMLYKYPQAEFPYRQLLEENQKRGRSGPEYELLDTGVFEESRYFDVFIEYAKSDWEDILIKITAYNRGPEAADSASFAHTMVSQHLVLGKGLAAASGAKVRGFTGRSLRRA